MLNQLKMWIFADIFCQNNEQSHDCSECDFCRLAVFSKSSIEVFEYARCCVVMRQRPCIMRLGISFYLSRYIFVF